MADTWYVEYSFKQHVTFHEGFKTDNLRSALQASPASRQYVSSRQLPDDKLAALAGQDTHSARPSVRPVVVG